MRPPPPVGVTCSGGGAWRAGQAGLAALAAAVFVAWLGLHLALPAAVLWAAAAGAVAGTLAWRLAAPRPVQLRWDGSTWTADGEPGRVELMLDLQRWLLLRFRPSRGPARWLPLPEAEAGAACHALRAALYARQDGRPDV